MNRKINLFTALIFTYSAIVCVTFKKDVASDNNGAANSFSTLSNMKAPLKASAAEELSKRNVVAIKFKKFR
ncbi:MAG TPA: hypothetical protein PLU10_03730 [Chitinophagaceae bacterium]|nr:hypothetical protein [Chitinophagaceae bacterium]